jgi:NAD(P)-dependent dehydrogenase (short-subunit alcohol dehydrogenase family)
METRIDLEGLRVAVTGGTSGLGLALVQRLAVGGARVAFGKLLHAGPGHACTAEERGSAAATHG